MFNWIKKIFKNNHALVIRQEWIVGNHEFQQPHKNIKKKIKKKTKKKTKKER